MSRRRPIDKIQPRTWDDTGPVSARPSGWLLLLSGGAARGAFQIPIIEHLIRTKGPPAAVIGTSVGAVHAAAVGTGEAAALRVIWEELKGARGFQRPNLPDLWNGLFNMAPLRVLARRHLGPGWYCPTGVGIVNLETASHTIAWLNELSVPDDVIDGIIASSSQPGVHERARFLGDWCSDGGVMHVLPVPERKEAMLGFGGHTITEVHAVCCFPLDPTPVPARDVKVNEVWEQVGRALDILVTNNSRNDIRRLIGLKAGPRGPRIAVYNPPSWGAIGPSFDADPDTIRRRFDLGSAALETAVVL